MFAREDSAVDWRVGEARPDGLRTYRPALSYASRFSLVKGSTHSEQRGALIGAVRRLPAAGSLPDPPKRQGMLVSAPLTTDER